MAHEKEYFVSVAQVGSNWMLVHRSNDEELAHEIADGQPDGTGFVVTVSRNRDPGLAGGMEAEARHEAEQLEGKYLRRARSAAAGTPMTEDQKKAEGQTSGADTARRAADLVERGDRAVENAAAKTENQTTTTDAAGRPTSSSQAKSDPSTVEPDPNAQPSKEDQAAAAKTTTTKEPAKK